MAMLDLFTHARVRCLHDHGQHWDPAVVEHKPAAVLAAAAPPRSDVRRQAPAASDK